MIRACREDLGAILALYQSCIGSPGCTWNMNYPSAEDAEGDLAAGALWTLRPAAGGTLLGVATGTYEPEVAAAPCWDARSTRPCCVSRLGIAPACRNHGLAKVLLSAMEDMARQEGYTGLQFLVSQTNAIALAAYAPLGYSFAGETSLFGEDWLCYERVFTESSQK